MANIDENTLKMALVMHEGIDKNIFTPENTIEFVIDLTVTEDNKQLRYMAPSMDSFDPGYDGYPSRKNIYYIIDWGDGNIEGFFNKYLEAKVKEWNNLQTPPPHSYSYNDIDGYYYISIHHNYEQSGTYNIKLLTNYIYYSRSYNWTPFTGIASSENYKKIIIGDNYILREPNEYLGSYWFHLYTSNLIYLKLPQNEKTSFLKMEARNLPLLEKIDGTNKITEIELDGGYYAKKITELSFPSSKVAYSQTFAEFHNLTNLYLPKLQIMDYSNFSYLLKIKEINLPSLEYIINLSGCFYNCPLLEYINLPKLKTINTDPMNSNQEPSTVYAGSIFNGLPSLKELHLDNLENIYEGLTSSISNDPFNLYLSNAVKTIYYNGLRMIGNLYFNGTKEEFEKIEKVDGWINPQFIKVFHIFCKDGEYVIPEIDPNETKIRIYTAEDDMRIIAVTYLTDNFTAIIDWGDGTQDTINNAQSTSNANTCLHKYSQKGYYDVKIISSDMTKFGISFYNAVDPSDTKKFKITNIYYWSDKIVSFDESIRYPGPYSIPWSDNIKKLQEGMFRDFFPNASQLVINFQNIEEIDNYVFHYASHITLQELKLLKCKKIGSGAFQNSTIKKIDAPVLKELGGDVFIYSNLEEFSAPLLETGLQRNTFYREGNCIITIVHLESIKELPSGIFYNAPGRKKVDEYGNEIDGYEGLSLFISKKLEKIEGNTFDASEVDMNVNIYFDGLEQDWEMIEKENFWYYAYGNHNIDITVICNDNTIYYHYSY